MEGYKVTIRLLDPPLHEFLPNPEELKEKMNKENDNSKNTKRILNRARELAEINPMMGHRGVRVAITYPEIYKMQITAVFEAAAQLAKTKVNAKPQIMRTNDLTQAVFSFSREDAEGKFLPEYMEKELLETSPFQSIDVNGVGHLMRIGIKQGRDVKKDLEIGICGEHGGDPNSIKFCHSTGVSYVSASPHRIPIAILAAAQAVIEQKKTKKSKK